MMYANDCGGYCEPMAWSPSDKKALLKEQEAIFEAKLATIRHWIDSLDKEDNKSK